MHLYPPEVGVEHTPPVTPPATPPTPKQKQVAQEPEREWSKLKRSYSSPDLVQDLQKEDQKKPAATPTINRDTKYAPISSVSFLMPYSLLRWFRDVAVMWLQYSWPQKCK